MRSPLERLKHLPWLVLFQVASLTAFGAVLLEYAVVLAAAVPVVGQVLGILGSPTIALLTIFVIAMAVGALAVIILERFQRISINVANLWALVACTALVLVLVQAIGLLPLGWVGMSYPQLIGVVLGVFLKGQPYWKSYRRW